MELVSLVKSLACGIEATENYHVFIHFCRMRAVDCVSGKHDGKIETQQPKDDYTFRRIFFTFCSTSNKRCDIDSGPVIVLKQINELQSATNILVTISTVKLFNVLLLFRNECMHC